LIVSPVVPDPKDSFLLALADAGEAQYLGRFRMVLDPAL
jgi:hypothetical protein